LKNIKWILEQDFPSEKYAKKKLQELELLEEIIKFNNNKLGK
jgi:hypothetical protein